MMEVGWTIVACLHAVVKVAIRHFKVIQLKTLYTNHEEPRKKSCNACATKSAQRIWTYATLCQLTKGEPSKAYYQECFHIPHSATSPNTPQSTNSIPTCAAIHERWRIRVFFRERYRTPHVFVLGWILCGKSCRHHTNWLLAMYKVCSCPGRRSSWSNVDASAPLHPIPPTPHPPTSNKQRSNMCVTSWKVNHVDHVGNTQQDEVQQQKFKRILILHDINVIGSCTIRKCANDQGPRIPV